MSEREGFDVVFASLVGFADTDPLAPANVEWSRMHFSMMTEGGMWGIPRSGLVFQRRGDRLVLTAEMPWMPEMDETITPAELREQQDAEFEAVRTAFGAAGIEVVRAEHIYREDGRDE